MVGRYRGLRKPGIRGHCLGWLLYFVAAFHFEPTVMLLLWNGTFINHDLDLAQTLATCPRLPLN